MAPIALCLLLPCFAQIEALSVTPVSKAVVKRGETATLRVQVRLKSGYHVNSNKPNEDYLIPLRLTWEGKPLKAENVKFPAAKNEKYEFSEKPVSVYTEDFEIETKFDVPADAPAGMNFASGKLRYQACSLKACLPPKTLQIQVPLEIR